MANNNCSTCGAKNELLISNCAYCGNLLAINDTENEADELEELIKDCSNWIGKFEAMVSNSSSLNNAKQLDSMSSQPIFGSLLSKTFGSNAVSYSETLGEVNKHMDLLEIKAAESDSLRTKVKEFKARFRQAKLQEIETKNKTKKLIIILIIALICFIGFCLLMSRL